MFNFWPKFNNLQNVLTKKEMQLVKHAIGKEASNANRSSGQKTKIMVVKVCKRDCQLNACAKIKKISLMEGKTWQETLMRS